jgi:hypothetical protein
MESESIVVMEDGADWPAWVDEEAGAVSNVVVLARQPFESVRDFELRTELRLTVLADRFAPQRGILVCGPDAGAEVRACRSHLLHALAAVVRRAGGGEVVLVGNDDGELVAELSAFVERLNQRDIARQVSVRTRQPPAERVARVA